MNTYSPEIDLIEMRRELDELRAKFAKLENSLGSRTDLESNVLTVTDRRGMMKKMVGLAAGVAAVGLLRPATSKAVDGGNFILGGSNVASNTTELEQASPAINKALLVVKNAISPPPSFLDQVTPRRYADESVGVYADTRAEGSTTPDAAVAGVFGRARANGTGLATGVIGDGSDIGVRGVGKVGVEGSGENRGVVGEAKSVAVISGAIGVEGRANVSGNTLTDGPRIFGVRGTSTTGGGGSFKGIRAAVFLEADAGAAADPNLTPPPGSLAGDLYRGSNNGSLWYRAEGTDPYRRLADSTTAGALTAFAAPSRFVKLNNLPGGTTNTYQIGGTKHGANAVPSKARAIIGRIAVAHPTGPGGNLLLGGTNPPVDEVIGIVDGESKNSFFFSVLDATGKLYAKNTSASGSVDVNIDIAGYYE